MKLASFHKEPSLVVARWYLVHIYEKYISLSLLELFICFDFSKIFAFEIDFSDRCLSTTLSNYSKLGSKMVNMKL
jgi:hypothetical protein